MRRGIVVAMCLVLVPFALALTPRPDESAAFFAGEWSGSGPQGSFCYLNLDTDGSGWVFFDAGSGDWRGASIRWSNRRQSLQLTSVQPLAMNSRLRVLPLEKFALTTEFNQTLHLTLDATAAGCYLQKPEANERHLGAARATLGNLRTSR